MERPPLGALLLDLIEVDGIMVKLCDVSELSGISWPINKVIRGIPEGNERMVHDRVRYDNIRLYGGASILPVEPHWEHRFSPFR